MNTSLYSRENISTQENKLSSFLKATYQLFAGSLLAATAGTYIGMSMINILMGPMKWVLFAIEIIMIMFIIPATKHKPGINLIVLFAFTFITGLTVTPLIMSIMAMPSGIEVIGQAFLITTITFGAISMFAMTTKKDYTFMRKYLLIGLIVLIVAGISNIFIQSSMLQLSISAAGAFLFSALILHDTQSIIKGEYDSPVTAALSLYLNFLNLFISLLQILGITNSSND